MNDQNKPMEWKAKANAEYQKVISSIISLSTAALVLPALLLKDFVGLKAGQTLYEALSTSVFVAWFCLIMAIAFGIAFYYVSAKWLKQAYGGNVRCSEQVIECALDGAFWAASICFIIGLALLLLFFITHMPKS